jgi:MOSC domain-containing protein YiiM
MQGTVKGLHASPKGGIRKPAIEKATLVVDYGIEGDASEKHRRLPHRALCLYSDELYAMLNAEGLPLKGGDLGENLVLSGVDFTGVRDGDVFLIGDDAIIEISEVRVPCKTLTALDGRLPQAIVGRSGFLAYVREAGQIQVGDVVRLVRHAAKS